jgi:hypothetical protein
MQNGYHEMRAARLGHNAGDEARKSKDGIMVESENSIIG